jgi:serine/threonine-protein kinase RsbW
VSDSTKSDHAKPALPGPVSLRVATGPLAAPVLNRVAAMVLAHASCPLDRLEDALILCDAVAAHAPPYIRDSHIGYTLIASEGALELRVAELRTGGAERLIKDARLPDVGNVIERFSNERRVERAADEGGEELVLLIAFG